MRGIKFLALALFAATLMGPSLSAFACVSHHAESQVQTHSCHAQEAVSHESSIKTQSNENDCVFCKEQICAVETEKVTKTFATYSKVSDEIIVVSNFYHKVPTQRYLQLHPPNHYGGHPHKVLRTKNTQSFTQVFLN